MKIYTNTIDLAQPVLKRFWVAPHSDFKLGIKIVKNGVQVQNEFTVTTGATELIADETLVDGFTVYTISSGDTGFVEYTVNIDDVAQKMKVLQITTDSTVFEVDERGGDMSQYATKNWVEAEISGFVTKDALSDFITAEDLTAYATEAELSAYATKAELTGYVENGDLTAYYTKSETSSATEIGTALEGKQPAGNYLSAETEPAFAAMSADIVVDGDLTAYYTKSETSSSTEIGTAFNGKVTNLSSVSGIMKISQADYDVLSAGGTADTNTLYVIV